MVEDGGETSSPTGWVLNTVHQVHQVLHESTSGVEIGERLPEAVVDGGDHEFAWIGTTDEHGVRVRAAARSVEMPERLDVSGTSQTALARETGTVQVVDGQEAAEMQSLDSIPESNRLVSLPLATRGACYGVLHLHTDCEVSSPATTALEDVGTTVGNRFAALATTHQLARERRRIETFRSLVSHDIGNPLNIASGRLELAADDCESEHLGHAADALERVDALIERGLTFVQTGKPPADESELSLRALAEDSWSDVGRARGTLATTDERLTGERQSLRRLLNELIRNAFDHSDGEIRVSVGPLEDDTGFYVADTGPGIPDTQREYVFELGYTTTPDREGVGLTVVREIAGAHGWQARLGETKSDGTRIEIITDSWQPVS